MNMKLRLHPDVKDKLKDKRLYTAFIDTFTEGFIKPYLNHEMCFNGVRGFMNYHTNGFDVGNYYIGFCFDVSGNEVLITHVDIENELSK